MTRAISTGTTWRPPDFPSAMSTALGARERPMTQITGPTTIGGKSLLTTPTPKIRTTKLSTTYRSPEAARPQSVPGTPQAWTP